MADLPIIIELLSKVGFPIDRLTADLAKLKAKYPDAEVPIGAIEAVFSQYFNLLFINQMKDTALAEVVTLVRTGSGPVSHDPVDLA